MSSSSKTENIGGDQFDPHYRYKMPKLSLSAKKGLTIIDNLALLAKTLGREPSELLKMWSYSLGTHSTTKTSSLGGTYTFTQLHDALLKYIDEYVICGKCGNPETIYTIHKGKFCLQCRACSGLTKIKSDTKLTKYLATQTKIKVEKTPETSETAESLFAQFEMQKFI
jgi:translation initiation factor 2 beta subunit (eIF-2beta)/eIF-5